jgi:hypothetical protein
MFEEKNNKFYFEDVEDIKVLCSLDEFMVCGLIFLQPQEISL